MFELTQDNHVHSTFSDGRGTLEDNIQAAEAHGLTLLACVDHVRRDTDWLPSFTEAIERAQKTTDLRLVSGVETKLLDAEGQLDLPADLAGVERVYVADHQVPWMAGPIKPWEMRQWLADGIVDRERFLQVLIGATAQGIRRCPGRPVVAHLFSVLPKVGLGESDVDLPTLAPLIDAVLDRDALVEVDERWQSPGIRVVRHLAEAGVPIVASSDAHQPDAIGVYPWASELRERLAVPA